ncbi:hypothetical protein, partial [Paraburkholderia unamae]
GKRRSSCFKSRTTNLLADSAADTPNVKKDRRSENVLCRPSLVQGSWNCKTGPVSSALLYAMRIGAR